MTDPRALAVESVALKVLAARVETRLDHVKAELAAALSVGDRTTARLDDDTKVGSVTYTKGRLTLTVTDPRAFALWVATNYPDEVEPQVRPAFLKAVQDASRSAGVPMTPDGQIEIPGVQMRAGEPYLSVKPEPAGVPALVDAIRTSRLLALDGAQ